MPPSQRLKKNEDWDITRFLYIYTVVLNRTEKEFWCTTPKRLFQLIDAHIKFNTPSDDKKKNKEVVYLDHGSSIGRN